MYAHKQVLNTDDLTFTVEFTMTYLASDEETTLFSFPLNYARPAKLLSQVCDSSLGTLQADNGQQNRHKVALEIQLIIK